jgi:hypothetical protein
MMQRSSRSGPGECGVTARNIFAVGPTGVAAEIMDEDWYCAGSRAHLSAQSYCGRHLAFRLEQACSLFPSRRTWFETVELISATVCQVRYYQSLSGCLGSGRSMDV